MKQTLLELTQDILSSMSSDEVNSISDSPESLQVANIIKQKYFDIIARDNLNNHDQPFKLDPSLDETSPVLMYIPPGISRVEWIKYFNSNTSGTVIQSPPGYQYVTMLPIAQFLDMTGSLNPSESNVESFTFRDRNNGYPGDYTFYYRNNKQPSYCTVISNYYVIFDSFDGTQDSTLQSSKSMGFGRVVPVFLMEDTFIPVLDDQQFPLLLAEAKSLAFYELKQQAHQLAMQETKRQWSSVSKTNNINDRPTAFDSIPNYGRYGRGFRSATSMFKNRGWDV